MQTSLDSVEDYFNKNIKTIGGVIEAYYMCDNPNNEHYPNIQDIFKYCNLPHDEEKVDPNFEMSENDANYLSNHTLMHYYFKRYNQDSHLFTRVLLNQVIQPIINVNKLLLTNLMLTEFLNYHVNNNGWLDIVNFFEKYDYNQFKNHRYIFKDVHSCKFHTCDNPEQILSLVSYRTNDIKPFTNIKRFKMFFKGCDLTDCSPTLEHLIVCSKTLENVPIHLINLTYLELAISSIIVIPDIFINLEMLKIDNSKIKEIPTTLIKLKELKLEGCDVSEIPNTFMMLKILCVSRTLVSTISPLFKHLTELDVSNTNVSEIPETLINLAKLICYRSKITIIPPSLTNLEYVSCRDTNISIIPDTLTKLTYLCIYNTKVVFIPLTITKLKDFSCGNTPINHRNVMSRMQPN